MPVDLIQALNLPPEKAIAYFERKGLKITWDWKEQIKLNQAQAFTVAKAMNIAILQDIRDELNAALKQGTSFKTFQENLEPRLKAKGWWGKSVVAGKAVQLGSPWRLKTIYQTNIQSSYNVGRFRQFEDNAEDRPFLQYVAVVDGSTTDICLDLDGQIHPVDSSFWDTNAPPNHYGCRSRLRGLTAAQAGRAKKQKAVTEKPGKGFERNNAKEPWTPDKKDYDPDIYKLAF